MLLLESLISIIGILKPELMSYVALFNGQTAEQYVIDGVTISIIGIFKPELMSFVALFTGQTAEQYVITGVTNLRPFL